MFKRHISKRTIATVATVLVAAITTQWLLIPQIQWDRGVRAEGETFPTNYDSVSSINYATILGRATDFGIVADKFDHHHHIESTFAVNHLYNYEGNVTEVDFIDGKTAEFIVAHVDNGYISFGQTQEASFYNIEVSEEVYDYINPSTDVSSSIFTGYPILDRNGNTAYTGKSGRFNFDHNFYDQDTETSNLYVTSRQTSVCETNVALIIENMQEWSDTIAQRARSNSGYSINPDEFRDTSKSDYYLDLNRPEFANRVVYINVSLDSDIYAAIKESDNLTINKLDSTVVVFNFDNTFNGQNAHVNAFFVDNGSGHYHSTTGAGNTDYNDIGNSNTEVDVNICQTVIWNFPMESGSVTLEKSSGAVLIRNSEVTSEVAGPSAGWIVTAGELNVERAEFHYIYSGGSQNMTTDGAGQIHFKARKAFTDQFNGVNTVPNDSIYCGSGAFTFNWYETDSSYDISNSIPSTTRSNQATNTIDFPILEFRTGKVSTELVPTTSTRTITTSLWNTNAWLDQSIVNNIDSAEFVVNLTSPLTEAKDITINVYDTSGSPHSITVPVGSGATSFSFTGADLLGAIPAGSSFNSHFEINTEGLSIASPAINCTYTGEVTENVPTRTYTETGSHDLDDHYIGLDETWNYYYVVTEANVGDPVSVTDLNDNSEVMAEVSSGRINIHLQVHNDNGDLRYTVTRVTILGDNSELKNNTSSPDLMSGPFYTLGAFYNLVETDQASIQINKTITLASDVNLSDIGTITFDIKDGERVIDSIDLDPDNLTSGWTENSGVYSYTYTSSALTAGHEYTIVERNNGEQGAIVLANTSDTTDKTVKASDATSLPTTALAEFTNAYEKTSATTTSLEISKIDTDSGSSLSGAELTLTYNDADYPDTVAVTLGQDATGGTISGNTISFVSGTTNTIISNLPDGSYTLQEVTAPQGYDTASNISIEIENGVVKIDGTQCSPESNGNFVITMRDELLPTTGTILITKALSGVDPSVSTSNLTYYVILGRRSASGTEYYSDNGQWGTFEAAKLLTISVGQNTPIRNVEIDSAYTYFVTETDSSGNAVGNAYQPQSISGYVWTGVESSVGSWTTGSNPTSTITVTNRYTAAPTPTGSITISKVQATGSDAIPAGTTFNIRVTFGQAVCYAVDNGAAITTASDTYTAHLAVGESVTLTNIPVGVTYTVEEVGLGAGYGTPTYTNESGSITAAGVTATVENTYRAAPTPTGTLEINKSITLLNGASMSNIGDITFTITCPDGTSLIVNYNDFTNGSWSRDNMPIGQYSVAETTTLPSGSTYTVTTTVDNATQTLIDGGTVVFNFTNTYDAGSAQPTPTTPTPTDTVTPTPTDTVTPTPTGTDETTPVPTSSEETTPTETTPTESDSQETQPAGPATGAIIISKTISGAPLNELETITFVLTDTACGATREVPALTMENVANGLWGDAGNGTYYCIIDGLSAGVTYTIVESLDGHTSTYSLDAASSVTSASVAVVANDTVGVTLTDAYTTGGTTESSETVPTESSTDATESSNATEGTTETAPDVESVTLSGAVINSNYYTVNSDGTITLTDAGRRALGSGSFTFTITYVNGATRTQTIIIDSVDRVPTTGEGSVNSIAAIILLTSAAFVFAAKKLREEEQ